MSQSSRAEYDKIAHLYDSHPFRLKSPDRELLLFTRESARRRAIHVLDIACGTGNQLVANRDVTPEARLVGLDASFGMLCQARAKAARDISWVAGDAAALPFGSGSFDFIGCQFAFHHFPDKVGMLGEACRLLRSRERFVLHNMCPEECQDWIYYEYFPAARAADAKDFWPVVRLIAIMKEVGFLSVKAEYEHIRTKRDLSNWYPRLLCRHICSQLQAISDAEYEAGLRRLKAELVDPDTLQVRDDHLCLVTIRGERP
jgi:ubiquinone/menaquinone biosynthesis C-methylase UbiE